jgi:hypothetical protein
MAHFPMFLLLLLDCDSASPRLASTRSTALWARLPCLLRRISQAESLERLLGRLALTRIFDSPSEGVSECVCV